MRGASSSGSVRFSQGSDPSHILGTRQYKKIVQNLYVEKTGKQGRPRMVRGDLLPDGDQEASGQKTYLIDKSG